MVIVYWNNKLKDIGYIMLKSYIKENLSRVRHLKPSLFIDQIGDQGEGLPTFLEFFCTYKRIKLQQKQKSGSKLSANCLTCTKVKLTKLKFMKFQVFQLRTQVLALFSINVLFTTSKRWRKAKVMWFVIETLLRVMQKSCTQAWTKAKVSELSISQWQVKCTLKS